MAIQGGDVVWKITGDSSDLQKSFEKVNESAAKSAESIRRSMDRVGTVLTAAGAAITGAVSGIVWSFQSYGDEIAKAADRTGMTTEAISKFKYAAEQSGSSLGGVESAVKRMSKVLYEASEETASAMDALKALGLSVEELRAMNPENQFLKIADALSKVSDHTTKAALAQEIFGRGGLDLLPMLKGGADGIRALGKEAEQLGLVMDDKTARAAEALGDEFARLKLSLLGIALQLGPVLVPELIKLSETLRGVAMSVSAWMRENPALTSSIFKIVAALGAMALVLGPVLKYMAYLSITTKALTGAFALLGGAGAGAGGGAAGAAGVAMLGLSATFAATAAAAVAAGIAVGATAGALFLAIKAGRGMVLANREADASMMRLAATLEAKGVALDKASLATMEHNEAMEYLKKQITQAELVYGREISALNNVRNMHQSVGVEAVKSIEKTQSGYELLAGDLENQSRRWRGSLATLSLDTRHSPSINDMVARSLDNLMNIYVTRLSWLMNWISDAMKWIGAQMANIWGAITGSGPRMNAMAGNLGAMRATAITGAAGNLSSAQRQSTGGGGDFNAGGITLNVVAAPGQSPRNLAVAIADELPKVLGEKMRHRAGQRGLAWGT